LNFEEFNQDWQRIIADCQKDDIWLINVGSQFETSVKAVDMAKNYDRGIYAAVGLHPIHVSGSGFHPEIFKIEEYKKLIRSSEKLVAIGETGLDFFHDDKNFKNQQQVFLQHIKLAQEFNRPLILHSRNSKDGQKNAYQEILNILTEISNSQSVRGVIHCFGGTLEEAEKFLDFGFYIGFTGIITFPKAESIREIAQAIPLERILIETDCPFLAPEPYRGQRNQPQYVKFTAEKIAEIKNVDLEDVINQTSENATELFKL